ncbi:hypothetical protein [Soonwooa purpurea]
MQKIINFLGVAFKAMPTVKYYAQVAIAVIDAIDNVKNWDLSPLDKNEENKAE